MARFCFLPPTKRPTSSTRVQTTKQRERKSCTSSMSDGMLKRLEPVFIPKNRVKGVNSLKNKTEIADSPRQNDEVQNIVKNCQQTPRKLQPQVRSQKNHQPPRKPIRRELFPQKEEDEAIRNVLEIVDEQNKESKEVMKNQFVFPCGNEIQENSCKMTEEKDDSEREPDGFKKPKSLPKISKKRREKQRSINKSVLEIIRKTHQGIQKIRNQSISQNTVNDLSTKSNQENNDVESKKANTSLNVQVSICIPNSGIQKSQCTVQQSGSVEEEDIGYKRVGLKSFQNIQGLL